MSAVANPLLELSGLPRFDAIGPDHVEPAIDALIAEAQAEVAVAAAVQPVSWEQVVERPGDARERLGRAWHQVAHLNAVVNTPELRAAYNAALPRVTAFFSALGQDGALYAQYRRLADEADAHGLDVLQRRVLAHALRDFRLAGAALEAAPKARLADIEQELAGLSATFSEHVLDATEAFSLRIDDATRLAGLPADVVAAARGLSAQHGHDGWTLTLQMPCYLPVQTYAEDRGLRETLYRAQGLRASDAGPAAFDNGPLIRRILALRAEQAALLGFPDYAALSLATRMAGSTDEVLGFLRDLAARARPHAERDRAGLESFARDTLGLDPLEPWDIAFAADRLRQARYAYSAQEVKRYFTRDRVLAGLFDLVHALYGLRVEEDSAPVWHEDVRFYRLVDGDGALVGQFYLDLYARPGKRGGAWMDDCRNRRARAGRTQTPIVHLVCNFGRGQEGRQATFTHDEVTTLFHEMGHGLHQLLTRVDALPLAGINGVEWDAVELPSQFMENFCWEWERLQAMTAHEDTGAPLPRDLFERMLAARNFHSALQTLRQVEFALFDMQLHSDFDPARDDALHLLEQVRDEVAVNRTPAWHRFPHQFSHIFAGGYAAGYYSYKWAEVLSADAYAAFEEAPGRVAELGARFRDEVLARGGSRDAIANFRAFRGRDPDLAALLRHGGMSG